MNKILNECHVTGVTGNGIFTALEELNTPWDMPGNLLDIEYYNNRSGTKIASNVTVNVTNIDTLASLLYHKYIKQWSKLWDTLSLDYNPIENYNMVETANNKHTDKANETDTSQTNITATGNSATYGFNSETSVPSDSTDTNSVGNGTSTHITDNTHEENNTLKRSGNIGVTTSQQLIQSERELYMWNFYEKVFADVDNVLTNPNYRIEEI